MAFELKLKRNDLQPFIYCKAVDSSNTAIDLTGASVVFTMRDVESGVLKITRQSAGVTLTSASTGVFEYQWQSGDTDTTGSFVGEFEITPGSGGKFTLPVNKDLKIFIVADEDST